MRTSVRLLSLFVLLAVSAGAVSAQEIAWKRSYQEGRQQGQKASKPLAVFVGSGSVPGKVIPEGSRSSAIRKILADHYICVYLDADRADQQRLIGELGISSKQGLVLSDRTGNLQAYFHDGALSEGELAHQLSTFADPAVVVRTTLTGSAPSVTPTNSIQRISYYPQNAQPYQPVQTVPNYFQGFRSQPAAANC